MWSPEMHCAVSPVFEPCPTFWASEDKFWVLSVRPLDMAGHVNGQLFVAEQVVAALDKTSKNKKINIKALEKFS